MNSAVNVFVHAIRKCSRKCLAQRVGHLHVGSLPMIQPPFCSSCVAPQYESGTEFFYQVVPELHAANFRKKNSIFSYANMRIKNFAILELLGLV